MNKLLVIALLSLIVLFAIATLNNIFSNVMAIGFHHLKGVDIFYENNNNHYPRMNILI